MSDSRAASAVWLWPLMPFGPDGPRTSVLKACSKPPGSIIKTRGGEHEWLYRPSQSEMDRVAIVDPSGSGENPAWGEIVKAAIPDRDTESIEFIYESLYWDVQQIVAELPEPATSSRKSTPEGLAELVSIVRQAIEDHSGHTLIDGILRPMILDVDRSMRVLGIEWKTDLPVRQLSTYADVSTALKDAEESIQIHLEHYVTNVGAEGSGPVQSAEIESPLPDETGTPGYLGLIVDERAKEVRRNGYDCPAEFPSQATKIWDFFLDAFRAKGGSVKGYSRQNKAGLNGKIDPLGVKINDDWQLVQSEKPSREVSKEV